jgi:hypothetical protein
LKPVVNIAGKSIGKGNPCYLIGEIGINHNGDVENVFKLIDAAVDAKFDAVKFQRKLRSCNDHHARISRSRLGSRNELPNRRPNSFVPVSINGTGMIWPKSSMVAQRLLIIRSRKPKPFHVHTSTI